MENDPIGVIDSGLGGISILKEVRKLLPFERYLYYGDFLHNPYGTKSQEEVWNYVDEIVTFLMAQHCKLIIIACNTATMLTIARLRKKYPNFLFIGTEPAIKVAHDFFQTQRVLVLATPNTMESERFLWLKKEYSLTKAIFLPCAFLADAIEQDDSLKVSLLLHKYLYPYRGKIDVVVLGCTHYPFVKEEIVRELGTVSFIDSGVGIAKRTKYLLEQNHLLTNEKIGGVMFYNSAPTFSKKRYHELLDN